MAKLKFYYGTMRAGKSTLALQMNNNFKEIDKMGLLFTAHDRTGRGVITSRVGIEHPATLISETFDLYEFVKEGLSYSLKFDYIICDEVQFFTVEQVEQLTRIVDEFAINVYCFGILTDFKTNLFNATRRLTEVADEREEIEVKSLCWCGRKGIFNARTDHEGFMVREGEQRLTGDKHKRGRYEILCRKHYMQGVTKKKAQVEGYI